MGGGGGGEGFTQEPVLTKVTGRSQNQDSAIQLLNLYNNTGPSSANAFPPVFGKRT